MASRVPSMLVDVATWAVRLFPLLVLALVAVFPAYKQVWLGYVPVALGMAVAVMSIAQRERLAAWLGRVGDVGWWIALYIVPGAIQVGLLLWFRPEPWFDGLFVFRHGATLAATGVMDPMTYYPPAQAWWYASWFAVFGATALVAQVSQIPLSLGITWLSGRLAGEAGGPVAGRATALVVAWYPTFLGYVLTTPYYHYLYTLTLLAMVWGLLRWRDAVSPRAAMAWALLGGALAGLSALTKAVQLIAPLQAATWVLCLVLAGTLAARRAVAGVVVFSLGMAVVLAPWVVRNARVFDAFVPVCTSGGLVLYSANHPDSNGLYSALPDQADITTPAEMLAHSRWCSAEARRFIREDPVRFAGLAARKALHTWGSEATFTDLINRRGTVPGWIKPVFSAAFVAGWALVATWWALAAVRVVRQRVSPSPSEWLLGVLVLSNAVVYLVFEGGDRHHLPFVPLIAGWALGIYLRTEKDRA